MTYQQAKRLWMWRGSALALLSFSIWMIASAYAGSITA